MTIIMGKRVLITGAGGFVGRNIAAVLVSHRCNVIALDKVFDADYESFFANLPEAAKRLTIIEKSVEKMPDLEADYLIHAAAVTASPEDLGILPEQYLHLNLSAFWPALDWAAQQGVQRAVFISSSAVFPKLHYPWKKVPLLLEKRPPQPDSAYGIAKLMMERAVTGLAEVCQRPFTVVRIGSIYGIGERARSSRPRVSLVAQMITEALQKGTVTYPSNTLPQDWTFATDIGREMAALLASEELLKPLYHFTSARGNAQQRLAEVIAEQIKDIDLRPIEDESVPMTRGILHNSGSRLANGLRRWTSLTLGISETVKWFRTQLAVPVPPKIRKTTTRRKR